MKHARVSLIVTSVAAAAVAAAACSGKKSSSKPGTGTVAIADVAGADWSTGTASYRTHRLDVDVRLPQNAESVDKTSNFVDGAAPQGCLVRHFSASKPATDVDSGAVTITGYNASYSLAYANSSLEPTTAPITCTVGGTGRYECRFAVTGTRGGAVVGDVTFPPVLWEVVSKSNPNAVLQGPLDWPFGTTDCVQRLVPNPADPNPSNPTTLLKLCEQLPIVPISSEIGEQIAGGTTYGSASTTIGTGADFPFIMALSDVKSGATSIAGVDLLTGGPSLDGADASIVPTSPLTVSYQCYSTTAGLGCAGNVAELKVQSSTVKKDAFSDASIDGEIDCFSPMTVASNSLTMSMTVNSAQMASLLAGKSGGSVRMELIDLSRHSGFAGTRSVDFGAGAGVYGTVNE